MARPGPGTAGGDRIAESARRGAGRGSRRAGGAGRFAGRLGLWPPKRSALRSSGTRPRGIPVVVSMANLAASGGYWVSTPASRIFAEPARSPARSASSPSSRPSSARWRDWGVTTDGVQTTPLSGQPDLVGGLIARSRRCSRPISRAAMPASSAWSARRAARAPAEIDAMAQGRVWDGGTARQHGLVDQFGGLDDALAYAAEQAKLEDGEWHPAYLGARRRSLCLAARAPGRRRGQRAARRRMTGPG